MKPIVFLGPSCDLGRARRVLDADYRPPAAQADCYHAAQERPPAIGVIDGNFERVPALWHKEILFALSQGIRVYGAASLGALRAVECAPWGMVGVGRIFERYRDGELTDDDAVAVAHATGADGYRPLSDALVNIRATLPAAVAAGVIPASLALEVNRIATRRWYPERTLRRICAEARAGNADGEAIDALVAWWPGHAVDQKREDALAMLQRMRADSVLGWPAAGPPIPFEVTTWWEAAVARDRAEAAA